MSKNTYSEKNGTFIWWFHNYVLHLPTDHYAYFVGSCSAVSLNGHGRLEMAMEGFFMDVGKNL